MVKDENILAHEQDLADVKILEIVRNSSINHSFYCDIGL